MMTGGLITSCFSLMYTGYMKISSTSNPKVVRLQKLLRKKREREQENVFVAEGVRLLEEALKWGCLPLEVYWGSTLSERGIELLRGFEQANIPTIELTKNLIARISGTEASQGIVGLFAIQPGIPKHPQFLLVVDGVQDPGNLGTLMRSAKAMGVDGIITTPGTVDFYSPKVVRSAMGVHFAMPILHLSWEEIQTQFPKGTMEFWNMVVVGGDSILEIKPTFPLAVVIGSEAHGVSSTAQAWSDMNITIPMQNKTESLNAGVAGSIALYEIMRSKMIK